MLALPPKLWIVGCAQNCAAYLPGVFDNIERLRSRFASSELLILENDSVDQTGAFIRSYGQARHGVHALAFAGLNQAIPVKTVRLAHLRNASMAWLEQQGAWCADSLVLILDLDQVNQAPWDLDAFDQVLQWFMRKPKAAAVFANQQGPYYDLWALRHPERCPDDVWEAVRDLKLSDPELTDQQLLERVYLPRQFELASDQPPFKVESAFGGLGFYKTSWLARAPFPYCGERTRLLHRPAGVQLLRWQVAEHVSFHAGLRALGARLWIHPALLNWNTRAALAEGMAPNPASWRHLSF
jgi:hypothetical protein